MPSASFTIATFYAFAMVDEPVALRRDLLALSLAHGMTGTILVASEGINATVAGSKDAVMALLNHLRGMPIFSTLEARLSYADRSPFRRMKVKQRSEIVSLGVAGIRPRDLSGTHVGAQQWNELITTDDVVVIDMRNDYEHSIGSFVGALRPDITHFSQFPSFVAREQVARKDQAIAMYCTGGIRCEKASAYLLENGYEQVYQLRGGILQYLDEVGTDASLWQGSCFVFDGRVALDSTLQPADFEQCCGCRRPLSAAERQSPLYETGVSCAACRPSLSAQQREAFAERRHQVRLADAQNRLHIGAVMLENED